MASVRHSLGGAGAADTNTLVPANLPPYTPAGTNSGGAGSFTYTVTNIIQGGGAGVNAITGLAQTGQPNSINVNTTQATFTGTPAPSQNSTPFSIVQPTILLNYIIFAGV